MRKEDLKDLYLNWKGLEFIHSLKTISKWVIIIFSIIFIFISLKIQNNYVLGLSLIFLFLQILTTNNKEYYIKYREIFHKCEKNRKLSRKEWIDFLEKTSGLNSVLKWLFALYYNKKFERMMKNEYNGSTRK